jgi:hypothetical protein
MANIIKKVTKYFIMHENICKFVQKFNFFITTTVFI